VLCHTSKDRPGYLFSAAGRGPHDAILAPGLGTLLRSAAARAGAREAAFILVPTSPTISIGRFRSTWTSRHVSNMTSGQGGFPQGGPPYEREGVHPTRGYVASTCTNAQGGCRPFRPDRPEGTGRNRGVVSALRSLLLTSMLATGSHWDLTGSLGPVNQATFTRLQRVRPWRRR
jgi:hypothetical protein